MTASRIQRLTATLALTLPLFSIAFFLCEAQTTPAAPDNASAPVVTITTPANNSTYSWNQLVNYSVVVSWHGKSTQFQELPSNEVLITTTYIPDLSTYIPASSNKSTQPPPAAPPAPAGLLDILRAGCVGCHEFKAKATGPSFAAIAQRYPDNPASIDTLARYIRQGSTGVWGTGSMPPHPDLPEAQSQAMARWITKEAANPDTNHYVGTEGAIRMESPKPPAPTAGLIVTASYTPPPPSNNPNQSPQGQTTIILHGK